MPENQVFGQTVGIQLLRDFSDVCFLQIKRMEADELYWTKQHVLYGI